MAWHVILVSEFSRGSRWQVTVRVSVALIHHANQYLITDGYDNRPGITAILGTKEGQTGLRRVLELHRRYNVPANIHISGTLLEAIAWHQPEFLAGLKELCAAGLIELVGSCYGQNIMRFFGFHHNLRQLDEELELYKAHLGSDPAAIKTFWPPERLWDTESMAPVLTDTRLLNSGYQFVIVEDRTLLSAKGESSARHLYDRNQQWDPELFQAYRIKGGQGLIALPIASNLRQSIPPEEPHHWYKLRSQLEWLATVDPKSHPGDLIAIYGDDMEKSAGVGWDEGGPSRFEAFLRWVSENSWIRPVKLADWTSTSRIAGTRALEVGTFIELANHFDAGENYEKWYFDSRWRPYREYFSWSQGRVEELDRLGADRALITLAEKHLLASNWETAWHTPSSGAHGHPESDGGPSPWIKALASHSRHAAVIAEAGFWMRHKDDEAHAYLYDIDNDGHVELIVKNDKLFAVFTPRWGGRLVYLFSVDGPDGTMLIGNPADDWNLLEEVNKYMEVPCNHPGSLVDCGFEHDSYSASVRVAHGGSVHAQLQNSETGSSAFSLLKELCLNYGDEALKVTYHLPESISHIEIDFGLSPNYVSLLRHGCRSLKPYSLDGARGWRSQGTAVWVRPESCDRVSWARACHEHFGHGRCIRLASSETPFALWIGVDKLHAEAWHAADA